MKLLFHWRSKGKAPLDGGWLPVGLRRCWLVCSDLLASLNAFVLSVVVVLCVHACR
jgi:hypothetical protein